MRLVILLYKNSFNPRNPLASNSESILTLKSKKFIFNPPFYYTLANAIKNRRQYTVACCFKLPNVTGPGCRTETLGSSSSNIRKICAAYKLNADPWVSEKQVPSESPRSSLAAFKTPTTSLHTFRHRTGGTGRILWNLTSQGILIRIVQSSVSP